MSEPVKFTFDNAFDGGTSSRRQKELDQVRAKGEEDAKAALEQGRAEGRDQTLGEIEQATLVALGQIQEGLSQLFRDLGTYEAERTRQSALLAHAIGNRLATSLMEQYPLSEIERLVSECLESVREEQRVVVRAHESLIEPLKERLDGLATAAGFDGAVVMLQEPSFGPQDIQVEWPNGGAERDMARIQDDITRAVQRFVSGDDGMGAHPPQAG